MNGCFGGNSCIWIIILLLVCGGCGNTYNDDNCGCGCDNGSGFGGNNSCIWIIILLLACGGFGGNCGGNDGCC